MGNDLSGRRALVTGGGDGIGAAIALALAGAGADVAVGYGRSAAVAQDVAARVHVDQHLISVQQVPRGHADRLPVRAQAGDHGGVRLGKKSADAVGQRSLRHPPEVPPRSPAGISGGPWARTPDPPP